jgi:antigen 43
MSGSVINGTVLYASTTGSTSNDTPLIGATVLSGVDSYGTAATPTTYTVNTALSLAAGAVFDAGSFSTLDLTTALNVSLLTTFNVGAPFTAPGGTVVPAGNGTLEFGAAALSLNALDTINFSGTSDSLIIDSGTTAPAAVNGFVNSDSVTFKALTFSAQDYYSTGVAGLGAGIYSNTGVLGAPVLLASLNLAGVTASNVKLVSNGSGGSIVEFVCFLRGTRLETPNGQTAVEDLNVGDLVATRQNGATFYQPVKWIGHRHITLARHPQPARAAPSASSAARSRTASHTPICWCRRIMRSSLTAS